MMSDSSVTCFLPSKNLIWDFSISAVNSPGVVIVAKIVSPGCVCSFWISKVGTADIIGSKSRRNIICFILF